MGTRKFKLNESEVAALQSMYQHSQDGPTRTRYQAFRLYGLSELLDHRGGGNRAHLLALEIEELSQLLHNCTPGQLLGTEQSSGGGQHWSIAALQQVVVQRYGVRYQSLTSYRTLLPRRGFSYQLCPACGTAVPRRMPAKSATEQSIRRHPVPQACQWGSKTH